MAKARITVSMTDLPAVRKLIAATGAFLDDDVPMEELETRLAYLEEAFEPFRPAVPEEMTP